MPSLIDFFAPYTFDPHSPSGADNFLTILQNPANYTVVENTNAAWVIELAAPVQGVTRIAFLPLAGFTPGAGSAPPAGAVLLVELRAASFSLVANFSSLGGLNASVADLIANPALLVSGNDDFLGSTGADVFFAGDGVDVIDGDAGNDQLHGEGASDLLIGDAGDDALFGGADIDVLFGQEGNDVLLGGDGDDALSGGTGTDTLDGGAGRDLASYFGANNDVHASLAIAGPQNTGVGAHTLIGIEDLEGGDWDDDLTGDAGANALYGNNGDDRLNGGAGADVMTGGRGNDVYFVDDPGDVVVELASQGLDVLHTIFDTPALAANLERLTLEGAALLGVGNSAENLINGNALDNDLQGLANNDTLVGADGNDVLDGGEGNDGLDGGAGDDVLLGGAGDDSFSPGEGANVAHGGDGVDSIDYLFVSGDIHVNLALQTAQHGGVSDVISSIENAWGSLLNDVIIGDDGANTLSGGQQGDDYLEGAGGADWLIAGSGADTLLGGAGDDFLMTWEGADTIIGGEGDDFIERNGAGGGAIDGGAGVDELSFLSNAAGVVVNLTTGLVTSPGGVDTIAGIEIVSSTNSADALTGDDGDNVLIALGGDDVLIGGAGDDTLDADAETLTGVDILDGGDGDDTLIAGLGADSLSGGEGDDVLAVGYSRMRLEDSVDTLLDGGAGFDTIDYADAGLEMIVHLSGYAMKNLGVTVPNFVLASTFANIEAAVGSERNDSLIGTEANNRLTGGLGSDWLVGGGGDDWFVQGTESGAVDRLFGGTPGADSGFDTIDYSAATGGVVVQLSGYATIGGVVRALFSGIEAAIGSGFADALIGSASNNRIEGGAGADWVVGAGGDDTFVQGIEAGSVDRLFGDAGIDTLDYSGASAGVTVQLSGYSTSDGATLATFTGIENAIGTSLDDALIGNADNNRIAGGAGADWLVGGAGNDTFAQGVEAGIDRLFGDAGTDALDYSGAGAGVVVQLSGYSTTSGGALLATFASIEDALGSSFNDTLVGNGADNRFTGAVGADWLVGGAGADRFVYRAASEGGDTIADFSRAQLDLIDLSAIDADPAQGGDQFFTFSTSRTSGLAGEAVATTHASSTTISLHLDADNIADMVLHVIHQPGLVMNANDFVL